MPNTFDNIAEGGVSTSGYSVVKIQNVHGGYLCKQNNHSMLSQGEFVVSDHKAIHNKLEYGLKSSAYVAAITICRYNLKSKIKSPRISKVYSKGIKKDTFYISARGGVKVGSRAINYGNFNWFPSNGCLVSGSSIEQYVQHNNVTNALNAQSRNLHLADLQTRNVSIANMQAKNNRSFYQAARFDNNNQITINSAPTNVVSVSVWVKYDAIIGNGPIIVKGNNAWNSGQWDWGIWADSNFFYATAYSSVSFVNAEHDNTSWYHIVLVRDNGSGASNFYVNGINVGTSGPSINNDFANTIYIGCIAGVNCIYGAVEEVQLFDYALLPSEIANMYNSGKGVYGDVNNVGSIIGLIAGYHLNNDLLDYKSGNDGVWSLTPAFTTGGISNISRQSANFNGSNRIAISQSTNIVAISVWVNFSSSSGFGPIIVKGDDTWASSSWDWGIFADSSNFYAVAEPAGGPFCVIPHDNNVWYHLFLIRDNGSGGCSMYVNGVLEASGTASSSNALGNNVFIGGVSGANMVGQVQEVEFFNIAPDPTIIAHMYNYGVGVYGTSIPEMIGGYHLDGNLNDYSAGSNNGTWTGTAAYTTGITDKIYKAAKFNGSSRIEISNSPTNVNSVSLWFKNISGTSGAIITKGNNDWNSGVWDWAIWHDGGATLATVATSNNVLVGSYSYNYNTWYHLVLVRDNGSGESKFYVNGNLIGTGTASSSNDYDNTIYIGGNGYNFTGQIQEVQLFSRGLTPEDVTDLYNSGNGVYGSSLDVGLVAGYHLDGTTIDYVNSYDGAWNGTENYTAGFMTSVLAVTNITTSDSFNLETLTQVSLESITTSNSQPLEVISPTINNILTSSGEILQFGILE